MSLHPTLSPEEQQPIKQSLCGSLKRDTHWKCLLLTLLICGCLTAITWCRLTTVKKTVTTYGSIYDMSPFYSSPQASPCDDGYVYIPVAFVVMLYLVYLVECWHCHTRIELQCKVDVNTVYERLRMMTETLPVVWWKAICYHYVRRTRQVTRYRNGDAFTSTQVYYERVNSHTASSAFNFSQCGIKDISKNLINLEKYPATKIRFSKGFSFAALEAEQEFEDQRCQFFQDHERRDDYMETREGLDLMNINFKEYMIAFADPDNLPWYISHIVFWIVSSLLLSWPLRVLIEYKTAYVHFHVHKLFGSHYMDSAYCTNRMTRVNTMESTELEMNIRNNYTIVPSYSEALLMDSACPREASILRSDSFHNGYIQIPGRNHGRHVTSGYVPGGGIVITNGIAHALSGPIPMSLSAGSDNSNGQNGGISAWLVQHGSTDYHIHGTRRKKRKRKGRRHSFTDADNSGASPTVRSQQSTADTSLPPSESCPEVLDQSPSVLPRSQSTVTEAPPSYELALNMRLPAIVSDPSANSEPSSEALPSLSRAESPPYRLMETSL